MEIRRSNVREGKGNKGGAADRVQMMNYPGKQANSKRKGATISDFSGPLKRETSRERKTRGGTWGKGGEEAEGRAGAFARRVGPFLIFGATSLEGED